MFGIDIGITLSSISCVTKKDNVLDYRLLFGDTKNQDQWTRAKHMADAIVDSIRDIHKSHPDRIIEPWITIEEPVSSYRSNAKSQATMVMLYTMIRRKLEANQYYIVSIHPLTVKAFTRRLIFGEKKLKEKNANKMGQLTKTGMVLAYKKVFKKEPNFRTIKGRETLADSYWIARAGKDKLNAAKEII